MAVASEASPGHSRSQKMIQDAQLDGQLQPASVVLTAVARLPLSPRRQGIVHHQALP